MEKLRNGSHEKTLFEFYDVILRFDIKTWNKPFISKNDEEVFESIDDIWPDYPTKEDFFFNEDEY